jgi:hypothetical protein
VELESMGSWDMRTGSDYSPESFKARLFCLFLMIIVDNGLGFGEDSVQQIYCDVF